MMTIILWILQVLLAVTFAYHGYLKFVPPADFPFLAWLYDIPLGLRIFIGVAEFAAVIGLILPGVMKTHTWLTPLAALGLVINMAGAIIFHIPRGEVVMIQGNFFLLVLAALIAYGRWRIRPLPIRLTNTT